MLNPIPSNIKQTLGILILGLSNRLLAFERFLELYPEYIEKVLLLQVAVPSRTDVKEYNGKNWIIKIILVASFNLSFEYIQPATFRKMYV